MDEIKTQPAVVAEITVTLPGGESFVAANLTVQFVSTMNGAYTRSDEIAKTYAGGHDTEHTLVIKRVIDAFAETVAKDCKITFKVSAFPVRVSNKPKPVSGWGSN